MSTTLSELNAEKADLIATRAALAAVAQAFATDGKAAQMQEFTIGRTTVKYKSPLEVAEAMASVSRSLERVRKQIAAFHRNRNSIVTHPRYGGLS
jgi:hypothetical protein